MSSEHVVIVGGAIIGSFSAWSLRQQGFAGRITVLEKDPTYQLCSTALCAASIRTQFGTPVNIAMSLYAAEMFRNVQQVFGQGADIGFREHGYLLLSVPERVPMALQAVQMQRSAGAEVLAMGPDELKLRFPGIHFDGVGLGTLGLRHEGWFDAWSLLSLVRQASRQLGVSYVQGEAVGFATEGLRVSAVKLAEGGAITCDVCVLAAGAQSGRLAARLGIDLPVVPKKRTVFCFKTPFRLANFPMLFDTSGLWVRPEGDGYIGGIQPEAEADHDADGDFEPHHALWEETFWPLLATRIPAMEEMRYQRAWAGHYEVNTLDHNGIVGPHDEMTNLILATGFSGHGVMHAPAVGRGVAELVVNGKFDAIDMSPLGWGRIRSASPMVETMVY